MYTLKNVCHLGCLSTSSIVVVALLNWRYLLWLCEKGVTDLDSRSRRTLNKNVLSIECRGTKRKYGRILFFEMG
jgi:hypothetical protein